MGKNYLAFLFIAAVSFSRAQTAERIYRDTANFNYSYWNGVADKRHLDNNARKELIEAQRNYYFEELNHIPINRDEIVWVKQDNGSPGKFSTNTTFAGPCTNIDFETGNMNGWTRTTGYHPLFNAIGCCTAANGAQA